MKLSIITQSLSLSKEKQIEYIKKVFKKSHPRTWLRDTQKFHDYITAQLKGSNINSETKTVFTNIYNPNTKVSETKIDDTDWLEVPNTVDVDIIQNRVENLL